MGITGNQKALMACRSGIARSGATRSNYLTNYDPVVIIDISGVPTDFTKYIRHGSLHVTQNLNDEVDTASFTLIPQCPYTLKIRERLRIGSGSKTPGVVEFSGQVMAIKFEQFSGPDRRPFQHVTCVDDLDVFDAHYVTDVWPTQSVTTTIRDLVARYTRGGFDASFVNENLPSIAGFSVANEKPSTVMRRITSLIGGAFLIEERRVYAWGAAGHAQALGTPPLKLVDGMHALKSFARTLDGAQQRTVAFIEGQRTEMLLGIPAVANDWLSSMPVEDASAFVDVPERRNMARIGTQIVTYETAVDSAPAGANPLSTTATQPANPDGSWVTVSAVPAGWPIFGWARTGNQIFAYQMHHLGGNDYSTTQMDTIAMTPTYGPLRDPVVVGDIIVALDALLLVRGLARDTTSSGGEYMGASGPFFGYVQSSLRANVQGTPVVLLRADLDATAANAIAARESSDGYHEHFVQDGRYNKDTCLSRAQAEIENFKDALVTYEWSTEDVNAKAGRMQQIDLTEGLYKVVDDVRIASVDIEWIAKGLPPLRACRATRVEPVAVIDSWLNEQS